MFDSQQDLATRLSAIGYFIDPVMTQVVFLASKLHKPLILEGPAGSGKTQLAVSVAAAANTHIERLQCYRGVTEDSFLGLPVDPAWAGYVLGIVERKKRIKEIDGIGCQPVLVSATTEEMLEWICEALHSRAVTFPVETGPVPWPRWAISELLKPNPASL